MSARKENERIYICTQWRRTRARESGESQVRTRERESERERALALMGFLEPFVAEIYTYTTGTVAAAVASHGPISRRVAPVHVYNTRIVRGGQEDESTGNPRSSPRAILHKFSRRAGMHYPRLLHRLEYFLSSAL